MKLKLFPSAPTDQASEFAADRSVQVPFFPHRRVSRKTALRAAAVGVWPVLIGMIFATGARARRLARQAKQEERR